MALKIKYPTLITSELTTHHLLYQEMVDDVVGLITAYSRRAPEQKLQIQYRGKSRVKVIENINYSRYNIGNVPCVQLCVQEYKTGQENLYIQKVGDDDANELNPNDKLGSNQNYALLYPLIDQGVQPTNRWFVIIYVTPGKDDIDMVNTIKNVVNKIFNFQFKYIVPMVIHQQHVIPKVEVTLSTIENVDNTHFVRHDLIVNSSSKSTKKVEYVNISADAAEEIYNYNREVNANTSRMIRFFHSAHNKSAYTTYKFSSGEDGVINTVMTTKYSENDDIEPDQLETLYEVDEMRSRFYRVLTNYLSNGMDGQNMGSADGDAEGNR